MTITVKSFFRKIGFSFNIEAFLILSRTYGIGLDEMDKIPKEDFVPAWLLASHEAYSRNLYRRPILKDINQVKRFIGRMPKNKWDKIQEAMLIAQGEAKKGEKKK